ncbi:MAG: tRNA (N6-isopentenyl adenosine(37)-C2)-methylthiotransferase MiaB [Christensenella sp.]
MNVNETLKNEIVKMGLTYNIITYGCQMNTHDSEKLAGILESIGYVPTAEKTAADFIIFNTCCVRENAEQKTFGNVGAVKKLKRENKNMLIAVCGCMMQQEASAKKLAKTFPFVDIIFGTHNLHELPDMIASCLNKHKSVLSVINEDGDIHEDVPLRRAEKPLATVNIMYGCNNFCSYCIVPYVRGRERSRDANNIITEINELAAQRYSEITLLGQNVNSYNGGETNFAQLLQRICVETDIPRVRFMTSHPKDLSDELIATIAKYPQLCRHIHLPVQSGSSAVLEKMNRKYTREKYIALVEKIRGEIPEIAVTTDIIVGFPGETEADFEETLSLVRNLRFDSAFTFVYSKRTGTAAADMPNQVDEHTQTERIVRLVALQNEITEQRNHEYEGKNVRVLVERVSTRNAGHVCGRTSSSKMVNFVGNADMVGTFCDVFITQGKKTTLFGTVV